MMVSCMVPCLVNLCLSCMKYLRETISHISHMCRHSPHTAALLAALKQHSTKYAVCPLVQTVLSCTTSPNPEEYSPTHTQALESRFPTVLECIVVDPQLPLSYHNYHQRQCTQLFVISPARCLSAANSSCNFVTMAVADASSCLTCWHCACNAIAYLIHSSMRWRSCFLFLEL